MIIERLVSEIWRDHLARPPASGCDLAGARELGLPDDLQRFYELSDGAYLHACDKHEHGRDRLCRPQ